MSSSLFFPEQANIDEQTEHYLQAFEHDVDLQAVADLDARAFAPHMSIGVPYLKEIVKHGVVFGEVIDGVLVSEAQVVLSAMKHAPEPLLRDLPEEAAYLEGFAVDPAHHSKGYGTALLAGAREIALAAGKKELLATVRLENTSSIRALTKQGYRGVDFDPSYYEGEPGSGARVILRQVLSQPISDEIERRITVHTGDQPDMQAQQDFQDALAHDYALASIEESPHPSVFLLGLSRRRTAMVE